MLSLTRYLSGVVFRLLIDGQCTKSQIIKLQLFQSLANGAAAAAAGAAAGRRRWRGFLGHAVRVAMRLQVRRSISVQCAHSLHCVYVEWKDVRAMQVRDGDGRAEARERGQPQSSLLRVG